MLPGDSMPNIIESRSTMMIHPRDHGASDLYSVCLHAFCPTMRSRFGYMIYQLLTMGSTLCVVQCSWVHNTAIRSPQHGRNTIVTRQQHRHNTASVNAKAIARMACTVPSIAQPVVATLPILPFLQRVSTMAALPVSYYCLCCP